MNIFPYRLRFNKTGKMRFLSHHDLMRLFNRAIRRAELQIRYSEGFTPHPLISFPIALPIGVESFDELMEIELSSWLAPTKIKELLNEQMPEGIEITSVEAFRRSDKVRIDFVEYDADVAGAENIPLKIEEFMKKNSVIMERDRGEKKQKVDVRQYVATINLSDNHLKMRIKVEDQGTAKPMEVLEAIGIKNWSKIVKTLTHLVER